MAGFDDVVSDDLVEDFDGFGERVDVVAEGVEELFCYEREGYVSMWRVVCARRGERGGAKHTFLLEVELTLVPCSTSAWFSHDWKAVWVEGAVLSDRGG